MIAISQDHIKYFKHVLSNFHNMGGWVKRSNLNTSVWQWIKDDKLSFFRNSLCYFRKPQVKEDEVIIIDTTVGYLHYLCYASPRSSEVETIFPFSEMKQQLLRVFSDKVLPATNQGLSQYLIPNLCDLFHDPTKAVREVF